MVTQAWAWRANRSGNTAWLWESHHDFHTTFSHLQDGAIGISRQQLGCSQSIISKKIVPDLWEEDEEGGGTEKEAGERPPDLISPVFPFFLKRHFDGCGSSLIT